VNIFAFMIFCAAAILAVVESRRAWWVPALIVTGLVVAFVVTHGTQVTAH
jgi:hypothetical protein